MAAADFCLIPARPSPADIEAAAPTLAAVRESGKPFAFVLNQTQGRSARLYNKAGSLGQTAAAPDMVDVLALPAIALRNDHQDALGLGLGVTEYARAGKSAEEIRALWQWVWGRLTFLALADTDVLDAAKLDALAAAPPANQQVALRAAG